ncbi:MAG TPA: SUMF1/EgtB/PvdO family nonheme iron enzyme [Sedimentisphaerales bacterium]|nr:SUMF1/EgtB/PvdO family nonheme iron enzyme [Sedimentisphaerales bacterium]
MKTTSTILMAAFLFVFAMGPCAFADCPSADLTGDCFVNFEDFAVMANQWLSGDPNIPGGMVYIPYGGFEMGDHFAEGSSSELPLHPVLIDAFFMSKYEVTNQQYCDYLNSAFGMGIYVSGGIVYGTGNNQPYCDTSTSSSYSQIVYSAGVFSVRTKGGRSMANDPMVCVSWYGSAAYCNWRSSAEGYESCYNLSTWDCNFATHGYRLPTEAEWEYAARGGNPDYRFPWGDTISHTQANYYSSSSYSYDISPTRGYHPDWDDVDPYTSVVGSFSANGYGLYDMAGNVWEWCNDWYDGNYYDVSPYDNPEGPASGTYRVIRGGYWNVTAPICAVTYRDYDSPSYRYYSSGFRLVLDF